MHLTVKAPGRDLGGGRSLFMVRAADNPDVNLADLFGATVWINSVPRKVLNVEFYGGVGDSSSPSEVALTVEIARG